MEVKNFLTKKEALFILNKDNYSLPLYGLKSKFKNCRKQKIEELINDPLKEFLVNLGIVSKNLNDNDTNIYKYPIKRESNGSNEYYRVKLRYPHQPSFYFDMPKTILKRYLIEYILFKF